VRCFWQFSMAMECLTVSRSLRRGRGRDRQSPKLPINARRSGWRLVVRRQGTERGGDRHVREDLGNGVLTRGCRSARQSRWRSMRGRGALELR
jgi:hypothetical protein